MAEEKDQGKEAGAGPEEKGAEGAGKTKQAELKISGMTCATCAVTIEKSLQGVEGVGKAEVNLGRETARVEYDPSRVKVEDLQKAGEEAGLAIRRLAMPAGSSTAAVLELVRELSAAGVRAHLDRGDERMKRNGHHALQVGLSPGEHAAVDERQQRQRRQPVLQAGQRSKTHRVARLTTAASPGCRTGAGRAPIPDCRW